MKIVDITDIEDLILAKHEIDLDLIKNKIAKEKSPLGQFLEQYSNLSDTAYIEGSEVIPFLFTVICEKRYLFVNGKSDYNNKIVDLLKKIDYDYSKLKPITNQELMEFGNTPLLLYLGKYYKIN